MAELDGKFGIFSPKLLNMPPQNLLLRLKRPHVADNSIIFVEIKNKRPKKKTINKWDLKKVKIIGDPHLIYVRKQ